MSLSLQSAADPTSWDGFLKDQRFRPFLQSWTMGEVYREIGQEPLRLEAREGGRLTGICLAHVVPARRGRHLSVPYGPVTDDPEALRLFLGTLRGAGRKLGCSFVRVSPFWTRTSALGDDLCRAGGRTSPLHLLAEHLWYVPLQTPDPWEAQTRHTPNVPRAEEDLLKDMRPTARNLIRRAQKEGVEVTVSADPVADLPHFLRIHDETRRRHKFTPYSHAFFRTQVMHFARRNELTLYLARYHGEVIASAIHMRFGGETSYHHGASTQKYRNIPGSYLLQWTALRDALRRGDRVYNFWGISPEGARKHPFAGVRTFKTAFGGRLLELRHCTDIPLSRKYWITLGIETFRKWKRGF